jgi:hypothetical protein
MLPFWCVVFAAGYDNIYLISQDMAIFTRLHFPVIEPMQKEL